MLVSILSVCPLPTYAEERETTSLEITKENGFSNTPEANEGIYLPKFTMLGSSIKYPSGYTKVIGNLQELKDFYTEFGGKKEEEENVAVRDAKHIDFDNEVFVFISVADDDKCTIPNFNKIRRIGGDVIKVIIVIDDHSFHKLCDSPKEYIPSKSGPRYTFMTIIPRPVRQVLVEINKDLKAIEEKRNALKNIR